MTDRADELPVLHVTTREIEDPGDLLEYASAANPLVFLRRRDGLVGIGGAADLTTPLPHIADAWRDLAARATVHDDVQLPGTGLIGVGSFPFSIDSAATGVLRVPWAVIGRRNARSWITITTTEPNDDVIADPSASPIDDVLGIEFEPGAMSEARYQAAVAAVVRSIHAGELTKAVLARDVVGAIDAGADLRHPLARLSAAYPDSVTFAVDGLLGASPETLVRVDGGRVTARVLAGTTARGVDDTHDDLAALALLGSRKDRDEHGLARASVVAALAPHTTGLSAGEPFTLELPNLWHLATDLHGTLSDGSSSLDLIAALHPTAAVAGSPTDRAVATIAGLEPFDRGRYAGPVGWIDATGSGEWAIALRCAQVADGRVTAYAGAGIVADSIPEQELAETNLKFLPILEAFA